MSSADQRAWSDAQTKNGVGSLDGRNFVVDLAEKGKTAADRDTLEFAGGRFHSTGCDQFGFGSGTYQAHNEGDAVVFTAVCINAKNMKNEWHGTIKGNSIEGNFTCTADGEKPVDYWYKGSVAQR